MLIIIWVLTCASFMHVLPTSVGAGLSELRYSSSGIGKTKEIALYVTVFMHDFVGSIRSYPHYPLAPTRESKQINVDVCDAALSHGYPA